MNQRTGTELRVGVVGAGIIAGVHLANLRQIDGVRVVAVCDVDQGRAEVAAREHGAQVYTDVHRMIDTADLHALFVCVPPFARDGIVERAASRGLHLYLEKPLALDLATARRELELVELAGVIASVGYMWRYAPVVDRAREALAGASAVLLMGRMLNGPPGAAWSFDRALSGGLLVEFATHMADLLRYVGGEVTQVAAAGAELAPGPATRGPDTAALTLRFAHGGLGTLETTWAYPGALWELRAVADDRELRVGLNPEQLEGQVDGNPLTMPDTSLDAHAHGFSGGPSWYLSARSFVDAVRTGDRDLVRCSFHDGVRTLALTLAADEALRTARMVDVPEL